MKSSYFYGSSINDDIGISPIQTRHVILISSENAYEDIPVFESKGYRNLYFEEILQSLQKVKFV